ncbi:MAG TPA: helix-turn-helix domain-containing protein, partial [Pseudomonas sp.]|nr:helix-turn-helix domain-containing protein [Pseudomonas sp.]
MKAAHSEALATTRTNPGETLRTAREAKHWSVADVAAQLNLTSKRLEQLETGDFDKLPGHTFARGYIRAYAKLLGMDQNRLVLEFDQYTGTDAAGSSVHSLGHIEEPVRLSQGVLRIVSFLLLVLLGGAGFYWWQEQSANRAGDQASIGMEHIEVESADGTTQIHPLEEPEDQAVAEGQAAGDLPLVEPSAEVAAQPEGAAPALAAPVENAPVAAPVVGESGST